MPGNKLILGACLGECIHVAGILSFLQIAEKNSYKTKFLGVAVPIEQIIRGIKKLKPDIVAISYRLSPETAEKWLKELIKNVEANKLKEGITYAFGGTEPVAQVAKGLSFFDIVFGGKTTKDDVIDFLNGRQIRNRNENSEEYQAQTLIGRMVQKYPVPLIRHHFGLPSLDETIKGIKRIAESKTLDIISLATDQDAQANFFHPERQELSRQGAGGVPVRTPDHFGMLYAASRCGNYPLMRTYAGTDNLIELAEVYSEKINNCFAAIPIFWFNRIDGRGPLKLREAIVAHLEAIRWHAERHIPVEINEPHHWSLRRAHDAIYVATSFLSAYIAKMMGVKNYVMQLMFDTPIGTSFAMDIAKMLAIIELVESLQDADFTIHRETRAGLMSYPADMNMAKGQLAYSVMLQMVVKPEIIHVVGYCEADHAATADEVIESCCIARKVIENALSDMPDITTDPIIQARKRELKKEGMALIGAIKGLNTGLSDDPLIDPDNLADAVRLGLLDAPQLIPSEETMGKLMTQMINGACYPIDKDGHPLREEERIRRIVFNSKKYNYITEYASSIFEPFI